MSQVSEQLRAELAPTGTLRVAINLSNFLLVSDHSSRVPVGVSPDMALAVAQRLGVSVSWVLYDTPGDLADTAVEDLWDIGNRCDGPIDKTRSKGCGSQCGCN